MRKRRIRRFRRRNVRIGPTTNHAGADVWGCEEYDDVLIHVFVHPSCSDFVCFLSVSALFLVGFLVPGTWQDMQLSGNRRNALSGAEDEDG